MFIKCHPNSWCDKELFIYWLKNIFKPYELFKVKKMSTCIGFGPYHKDNAILDYKKKMK